MLRRAPWKTFAPNHWTGIGGKVEANELGDLVASARRELFEETDLAPAEVADLSLRRTLTFFHPDQGLVGLLYFTGSLLSDRVPTCSEGTLAWVRPADLASLDLIDNTSRIIQLLVADFGRGDRCVRCGFATYSQAGELLRVCFDDATIDLETG